MMGDRITADRQGQREILSTRGGTLKVALLLFLGSAIFFKLFGCKDTVYTHIYVEFQGAGPYGNL